MRKVWTIGSWKYIFPGTSHYMECWDLSKVLLKDDIQRIKDILMWLLWISEFQSKNRYQFSWSSIISWSLKQILKLWLSKISLLKQLLNLLLQLQNISIISFVVSLMKQKQNATEKRDDIDTDYSDILEYMHLIWQVLTSYILIKVLLVRSMNIVNLFNLSIFLLQ